MLSWRLYRVMLLPALAAAVVLLFSVVSRPEALRTDVVADSFDAARATALARELQRQAPDRRPGGADDAAAAGFVLSHFHAVEGGEVSEQRFGDSLRNVALLIPGESSERVVIAAPRDCGEGDCAVTSGAATAALVELAEAFGGLDHSKTIELVSLDGSSDGAAGARQLAAALGSEPAEAVIVIAAPAAREPSRPLVVPFSSGPQSTSIQLVESAAKAVETELGVTDALHQDTISSLFRLAIPAGIGDQAPLIHDGHDALTLTSTGELPVAPSEDRPADLSNPSLGGIGRAALALALALDADTRPLVHGPEAYVPLAGKLIPGWAIALLAIALLAPVAVVSVDALARASRRGEPALPAAAWLLSRMIPFFATALLAYLMALIGLIPAPSFPFDPSRHGFGPGAAAASVVLIAAFAVMVRFARRLPLPEEASDAAAAVIGAGLAAATIGIWIANPFLALLLVPTAHLWLLAAAPEMRGRVATVIVLSAAGLVVPAVALVALGSRLGVGLEVPWQLLLMFTGRHFGPLAIAPLCLLGGCLLALLSGAMTRPRAPATGLAGVRVRGPLTYAGPGSLGGTESALPRR